MDWIKLIQGLGLGPILTSIIILLGLLYWKFKEPIDSVIKKLINRKLGPDEKIQNLKSHDIFNTFNRVKQDTKVIKFYSDGQFDLAKTRMCQDFANFKVDICKKNFTELIERSNEEQSPEELKADILSSLTTMHDEYILAIRNKWLDRKIKPEDVEYVIELFERFRNPVIQSFFRRTDAIFSSTYHFTNFDKLLACLDVFSVAIDLLPRDLQETFETANGKFKNINY